MPKFIDLLRSAAPAIAGALTMGGPAGIAAGVALKLALGSKPDEDVEAVFKNATPEQLLALKKADYDFEIAMRQAESADYATEATDRASARAREMALHDMGPMYLAGAIVVGFFIVLLYVLTNGMPSNDGGATLVLLGGLSAGLTQVLNYYFGSSRSASTAQKQIKQMWDDTPSAASMVQGPLVTEKTSTPAPKK